MSEQTNAAPPGYTTVAPWVVTDDTGAFLDADPGGRRHGRSSAPVRTT
ncbi:hypothetical protein SRB5_09250 [Streptomyces sp. RB5]|uniref:Uncharacterized protein n=1 Tax=Streptomyces smaragdinus TaxID=2585196 RepID=A0A7K0CCH0_9ACTN|nr:hypothetical protein [Streptomyces smaragdinus]